MIHYFVGIGLGYVIWKFLPGKITAVSKKWRSRIDVGIQVVGIIMMLTSIFGLIKWIFNFLMR